MTYDSRRYNHLLGGSPVDPPAVGADGAGVFGPSGGGPSGGLAGAASSNPSAEDLGASGAVSQTLVPLAASVLQAPAGTLTKDRLVGDAANFLTSARASGALSEDHFGHAVRSAIDFLSPFRDDTPDPVLRAATGQMLVNHLGAHGQVQALAGGGGGSTDMNASTEGSNGDVLAGSPTPPGGGDPSVAMNAASDGSTQPVNRLWASNGAGGSSLEKGHGPQVDATPSLASNGQTPPPAADPLVATMADRAEANPFGYIVNRQTGAVSKLGLDSNSKPSWVPVTDAEHQRLMEWMLDTNSYQPGVMSPEELSKRAELSPADSSRQTFRNDANSPNKGQPDFGALSAWGESRNAGPGTVSSGVGDPGGISYGTYQLATNKSAPQAFLKSAQGAPWAAQFGDTKPGTAAFGQIWRKIAQTDPKFATAQYEFAKSNFYQPQINLIKNSTGVDLSGHSNALQNVIWSTGVQGQNSDIIVKAMGHVQAPPDSPGYDSALIDAIYAERGRKDQNGVLVHFHSSPPDIQQSVANRFVRERVLAQRMLARENRQ